MTKRRRPNGDASWANRIVGEGSEAPDQLLGNPENFRIHTLEQQQALEKVLDRGGWVTRVIVNKRTGHVVDGHLRVSLAISRGEPTVPVTYVDLSEHEEGLALATYDQLASLAGTDQQKLTDLLELLPDDDKELARLVHADRRDQQSVAFSATKTYRVTVECKNEAQQAALANRLQTEGYTCRVGGRRG